MAEQSGSWEGKPVRAFLIRAAAFALPLVFAIVVAWQLTRILPTPRTWPGVVFWWLLVMASSTMALRFADRFAKKLMPLAVLMKLSLVFPDKAPNRFGVSLKSGSAHTLEELIERAERANRQDDLTEAAETILALAAALNAHDPRTRGHGDRVRAYADMLGEEMGYTDEERNKLKWAAMLHDIGKLRVPSEVINSPGKLTDEEWEIMRNHPDWGMELAAPLLPWLGEFAAAIGQHHERFDGKGYPNGLAGEEIGLAARVTSVADTYDVMTSVRSYKEARPASEAREELARCAGGQFDPVVVRAFLNISLGRQRWVAGPLSWLAQVPFFQGALQGATTLAQNAAVAAQTGLAATAIGATVVVAPALIESPDIEPAALPSVVVVANDDVLTLSEDGSDTVVLVANDDDVYASSITIIAGPSHGTVTVTEDGTLIYTPDPEFSGTDTVTYEACGPGGSCDTAVLSIEVAPVNDPPGLGPVPASLDEDTSTVIDVLAAVFDIDGDAAAADVSLIGVADEGLVIDNGNGTFTYTPPPDFNGTDSFTVQICDVGGACELRTLSVTVGPVNDAPEVDVMIPVISEDSPASIFVDASDADGDVLITTIVSGPSNGAAVVELDGSVTYTPAPDFSGPESLTIEVCDDVTCTTEVISFAVADVNDPPVVLGPGPLATTEDTMISFDPLAGASDPEGGALVLDSYDTVSANGGSIVEGSLEYTPAADFVGADSFSYAVKDLGGASTSVLVTVTVTGVNDDPTAVDDSHSVDEDGSLVVAAPGLLANDSDVDGDALSALLETAAANGAAVVNADGSFTYAPAADFVGADSFTYRVNDGVGGSAVGTVEVTVGAVNDPPIAADDGASTSGPGAVNIDVLANDIDVEGDFDPTSVAVVTAASKGTAVAKPDGTIDYTPNFGETGSDTFIYEVCDFSALCDSATVTVGINGPDAVDDAASMAEDASPITINVVLNDTDPNADLDPTSAVVQSAASNGVATANGDGTFDYDSDPNFNGVDTFDYRVCDLTAACNIATVTVTVTATNDAPVAVDDAVAVAEDHLPGVVFNVLTNDTDIDLDALSLDSYDGSTITNGVLTDGGGGSFTYVPAPNFFGVETFDYDVTDGTLIDTGTVTITVTNVPDAPEAGDDAYVTDQNVPIVVGAPGVLGNDSDYDGDPLAAVPGSGPSNGAVALNPDGSFTYTPNLGYTGPDSFTYTASDGTLASAPATVAITVDSGVIPSGWFLGDTGVGPDDYSFVPVPPSPGLPDPDGDLNPGLTIESSNGSEAESDPLKFQNWILDPGPSPMELNGPVALKLWSTIADYELGKAADLTVRLYDCDAVTLGACTPSLLTYDVHTDNWNGGVADFVYREVTLGSLTHVLSPGRVLKLRMQFDHEDVWVDMNAAHPTELALTLANVAPNAVDDAYPLVPPMLEDGPLVNFDVLANDTDPDLDPTSLTLEPLPVPAGTVVLKGDNTFDYTPASDFNGVDTFAYRVCDLGPLCSTATVTVMITSLNDAPVFTKGADQVVLEDSGQINLPGWATGIDEGGAADEDPQDVSFTITGSVAHLAKFDTLELRDDGELRVKPADDASGVAVLTATAMDDGGTPNGGADTSAGQTFNITITPVNDEPDFSGGPNVTVNEDGGPFTVPAWATAITAGAANEEPPVQNLTFNILTNDNPLLFTAGPALDPATGDLTWDTVADAAGVANLTLNLTDDGGTANGGDPTSATEPLRITVNQVNDVPSFTKGADETVPPDSGAHSRVGWATAISPGPANESAQTLTFNTIGNTNPALFAVQPQVSSTGTLLYTLAAGQFGSATITVELEDDGGTANGGVDTSAGQSFDIQVVKPKVVISEFQLDGPFGTNDEFIEIFNAGSSAVNLAGWKLHVTSGVDIDFFTFPSFTLNPGQHYLIANSLAPPMGADGLWIGLGYGAAWGDVQLVTGGGLQIDAFGYGAGPILGEGATLPLWQNPFTLDSSWERLDLGGFGNCVDTDDNLSDFVFRYGEANPQNRFATLTPCLTPPAPASMVIGEVGKRGPSDAKDEFIELFNPTSAPIDISGWSLNVTNPIFFVFPPATVIPPGGHYLLAGESYSGSAIPDWQVPILGINWITGTELVTLRDGGSVVIDAVAMNMAGGEGTSLPSLAGGGFDNYTYQRHVGGCYDTNDNAADFAPLADPGSPQSLSSPLSPCV